MSSDSEDFSDAHEEISEREYENKKQHSAQATDGNTSDYGDTVDNQNEDEKETKEPTEVDLEESRRKEEALLSVEELEVCASRFTNAYQLFFYQKRKSEALEIKEKGNTLFKNSQCTDAVDEYTRALDLCPLIHTRERSVLFSNRAACRLKMNELDNALSDCDKALTLDPNYVRCLLRRATLREEKERLSEALEDYQALLKLDPGNEKARWACITLPERIKKQQEEMKEKMFGQLKELGNMVLKPFGLSTENFQVKQNPESEGYSINFVR